MTFHNITLAAREGKHSPRRLPNKIVNDYRYQVEISEREVVAWHPAINAPDFATDSEQLLYALANQQQAGVLSAWCALYDSPDQSRTTGVARKR